MKKRMICFWIWAACMLVLTACRGKADTAGDMPRETDRMETALPAQALSSTPAPSLQPVPTPAPWEYEVSVTEDYRDNRIQGYEAFVSYSPFSYVPGKYLDIYETGDGAAALEQDGTLWKVTVGADGNTVTEKLCSLMDDSSPDEVISASYKDAHQAGDTLYFVKNSRLYACRLTDGAVTECADLSSYVEEDRYLGVLGGTKDAVLLFTGSRTTAAADTHLVWRVGEQRPDEITWQGETAETERFNDLESACMGSAGNEVIIHLGTGALYAADVCTGQIRRLSQNRPETDQGTGSEYLYGNQWAVREGALYCLQHHRVAELDMGPREKIADRWYRFPGSPKIYGEVERSLSYETVDRIPLTGEPGAQVCVPDWTDLYVSEASLEDDRYEPSEDPKALYDDGEQMYVLMTHLGPAYKDGEQGSILYAMDTATGKMTPVSGIISGMNRPGKMVVHDNCLYVISTDGREAEGYRLSE